MSRQREYVVARYEHKDSRFEILVDPDKALLYREGKKIDLDEVVVSDFIYKDSRKGLKASPGEIRKVFGTDDPKVVFDKILREGELQLTTEQRRKLLEAKRKRVIDYIARSAIDPSTKTPIPPARIEAALEQARVSIDLYKSVEKQAAEAVKAIAKIIPIKIARAIVKVKVPSRYAGKAYTQLMRLGEVKKSQWLNDGSLVMEIEIPAGAQNEVIDKIAQATRGEAQVSVSEFK